MAGVKIPASQRADLVIRLLDSLFERNWTDIDVILTSFGLPVLDLEDNPDYGTVHAQCRSSIQAADGRTLIELAEHVFGETITPQPNGSRLVDTAENLWDTGIARVFLSLLASENAFVGEVSTELARIGISSFVAHDSIDVTLEWQHEIERALRTADVLAGLVHPHFYDSYWTQQEVGWALGREIPVVLIGLGEPPKAFPARIQAPMIGTTDATLPWRAASAIAVWLTHHDPWRAEVVDRLVDDLRNAGSFVAGRDAAERLRDVGQLTPAILDAIELAYRSNDQLYPYHIGARVVEEILVTHRRTLPEDAPFLGPKLDARRQ
jgi:hypothetical protein